MGARIETGRRPRARARLTAPSVVLFMALLASQAAALVLTPILVAVADDLDVSTAVAGQLRSLLGAVAGVTALAFGRVARGVALRDLLLAAAGLLGLGSLLCAAAPSFAVLAVAQIPLGVAVAMLVSAGAAAAGEWVAPAERRRVLSWSLIGPAAAWIVGMPLVGLVAGTSWRLAFLVLPLAASGLVAFALSLCRKEQLPTVRPLVRLTDLVGSRVVGTWALGELLASSAWTGMLVFAGALFVESYGTSTLQTGLILGGMAVAYVPGNFAARSLLHRLGARTLLPWLALAGAVGVVLLGSVRPSAAVSAAVFAVLGFAMGGRTFAGGAFGLEAAPDRRLAVMGLRAASQQFGYLVGSVAGGVALVVGGYPALGIALGGFFVASAIAFFSLDGV